MAISRLFTKTVSTKRLGTVGSSHKETWSTHLASVECAIHPAGSEQNEYGDGAFYKLLKMWCPIDTDIAIGDRVIDGSIVYTVKGVATYDFGSSDNQHLSCLLVKGV